MTLSATSRWHRTRHPYPRSRCGPAGVSVREVRLRELPIRAGILIPLIRRCHQSLYAFASSQTRARLGVLRTGGRVNTLAAS